jgi:hypothetical protein
MTDLRNLSLASDPCTRRGFVQGAAKALLGVSVAPGLLASGNTSWLARALQTSPPVGGRARNVFRGGLSQLDTFDPKPGHANQGPLKSIRTDADGVLLTEHFPRLANHMDRVCVVNSMTSTQGAHAQGQYLMRTGYELRGTIQHPSLGAWTNLLAGTLNSELPGYVTINGGNLPTAGFFPPQYMALPLGDPKQGLQNAALPQGVNEETFNKRLDRLRKMNQAFAERYPQREVQAYAGMYTDAVRLMRSADLHAFDLALEPEMLKTAYGNDDFGQGCLLARRLVEHGVRFVEVVIDGWDTHNQNFDELADKLPPVDQALAALLADLDGRGLLGETLIVLATEFGRTPEITGNQGRNHYPKAFSCLLAGAGIRGGQRYGKTSPDGKEILEHPVTIQEFNATIATALGLPLDKVVTSPSGRPFKVADKGQPVMALLA